MTHSFPTRRSSDRHEVDDDLPATADPHHRAVNIAAVNLLRECIGNPLKAGFVEAQFIYVATSHWFLLALFRNGGGEIADAPWREGLATADTSLHLRSEEHTSELQSLMRISYAVF